MSKEVWRGGTLLAPLPAVLVTTGDSEKNDITTVAWTGILNTIPPKTYVSLRKSRYGYELAESGELVINLTTASMVKEVDYCGVFTGRKVDKFAKCGFTRETASRVKVPLIAECPVALECVVSDRIELGSHVMLICDIVATDVDSKLIDGGKLDLSKAGLMAFAHGEYFALGEKLGNIGFSAVKPAKKRKAKAGAKSETKSDTKSEASVSKEKNQTSQNAGNREKASKKAGAKSNTKSAKKTVKVKRKSHTPKFENP